MAGASRGVSSCREQRPRVCGVWMTWREAMDAALYGPGGFYARGEPPARHFRTSVHVSPSYAAAIAELLRQVDAGLGHPERIDLVDVGAGRGELLEQALATAEQGTRSEPGLAGRIAACAVEVAPRPAGLDPRIGWQPVPPSGITGLVIASEWLDNVPLDVVELTAAGPARVPCSAVARICSSSSPRPVPTSTRSIRPGWPSPASTWRSSSQIAAA